ncbi:MAG: hypothetical protein ACRD2L_01515, partial [Terriglobia bacterium]
THQSQKTPGFLSGTIRRFASNPQVYLPGERRLKNLLGTGETNQLFLKALAAVTIGAQKGILLTKWSLGAWTQN